VKLRFRFEAVAVPWLQPNTVTTRLTVPTACELISNAMTLNRRQKIVVWIGATAIIAALVYPPWVRMPGTGFSRPLGWSWIDIPPQDRGGVGIDVQRLGMEVTAILVITAAAIVTLNRK
jgi:hypothetical protein